MTQIDFYLLSTNDDDAFILYICRLVEKAFRHKLSIFLLADQQDVLEKIDQRLWDFREDNFLPHDLNSEAIQSTPIQLSTKIFDTIRHAICINLSKKPLENFQGYPRLIEIVKNNAAAQEIAREHYRFYQSQHHKPNTIDLRKN